MISPISHYRFITPVMILSNILVVAALAMVGSYSAPMLWLNWLVTGVLTWGIWHVVSRFRLEGGADVHAFAIAWPLMTAMVNFSFCYMPCEGPFFHVHILLMAFVLLLLCVSTLWQDHRAITTHLAMGMLIGLSSALMPQALLWLLFAPLWCFVMRCWSLRNLMSTLTATLLAVWVVYCYYYAVGGSTQANALLVRYVAEWSHPALPAGLHGLWQLIFFFAMLAVVLAYSIRGMFAGSNLTVRAAAVVHYFSLQAIILLLFFGLDSSHFGLHICLLAVLLGLQLTITQANIRSAVHEWWILLYIAFTALLGLLPLVLSPLIEFLTSLFASLLPA